MLDLDKWLCEQNVSAEAYDAEELLNQFEVEMTDGLNGKESSLAMLPSYVDAGKAVPIGKPVAVIDAGGTNLRICLATFNEQGGVELSNFSKRPMPGRDEEVSAAHFYNVLVEALEPIKDAFDAIGFCFSYPADTLPNIDARLSYWTKEIKIPELVGSEVGAGLQKAMSARGFSDKKLVLLNDTVATLLAGVAEGSAFNASSYIGFILGTGSNTAYIEENTNIGKVNDLPADGHQVINVESGGFCGLKRGPVDEALDAVSAEPGSYRLEKMLSGVYMGALTLKLLKALVPEKVFSPSGAQLISEMDALSVIHIDNLASDNGRDLDVLGSDAFSGEDRQIMSTVFTAIVDRAALLTAVNIAAAIIKCGKGTSADAPVCINIDGSTYYKTGGLEDNVQAHLGSILKKRGLHIRCIQVDDAPIVGAAIAGLTA